MNTPGRCLRIKVTGRVQGVGFRYYAKQEAERLGLTGWVRNLPNGDVEALICGNGEQLAAMQSWLSHGPSMARVETMHAESAEIQDTPTSFRMAY
ncbi:MAG: acylphosphatase [Mariprofundaceae bacterium]